MSELRRRVELVEDWPPARMSVHHCDDRGRPLKAKIASVAPVNLDRDEGTAWIEEAVASDAAEGPPGMRYAARMQYEDGEELILRWQDPELAAAAAVTAPVPPGPALPPPVAFPPPVAVATPALSPLPPAVTRPSAPMPGGEAYVGHSGWSATLDGQAVRWAIEALQHDLVESRTYMRSALDLCLRTHEQTTKSLIDQNDRLNKVLAQREHESYSLKEKLEQQRAEAAAAQIAEAAAAQKEELKQTLLRQAAGALPMIVASIAGKRGVIAAPDPAIAAFAESLRPEQVDSLLANLDPQQRVLILQVLQQHVGPDPEAPAPNGTAPKEQH